MMLCGLHGSCKETHPSIVQDQATEYWYENNIRRSGASRIIEYHEQNRASPDSAVRAVFGEWANFKGNKKWEYFMNTGPRKVHELAARDRVKTLDESELSELIYNTHSAKAHARQMRKVDLGDVGKTTSQDERCRLFAVYLLRQRSQLGLGVCGVLNYVLWENEVTPDVAERIWNASHDSKWKLPHLGQNVLSEILGYARPDDFPPRNGRVSKTLYALGFDNIAY